MRIAMKTLVLFFLIAALPALPSWGTPVDKQMDRSIAFADDLDVRVKSLIRALRFAEAAPLAEESLLIRENTLGIDHPKVAEVLGALGSIYKSRRKFKKSEEHYKRRLDILERTLGPEHPDVAAALYEMAPVYFLLGKRAEALALLGRAISIFEMKLGPYHIRTVQTLRRLAFHYRASGQWVEASAIRRKLRIMRNRRLAEAK